MIDNLLLTSENSGARIARLLPVIQCQCDIAQTTILRVGLDLESQFPAHFQHDGIFLENLPGYPLHALRFWRTR